MTTVSTSLISIVVPVYNEGAGLERFHASLMTCLDTLSDPFEIIYCDDGSRDDTTIILHKIAKDSRVRVIALSRNFGKEIATTAGMTVAKGDAVLTLDADGQHPVELIPEFIKRWRTGSKVVIGVRQSNKNEGFVKRFGSKLFYWLFNKTMSAKLVPGATDFRLIDRIVQQDFVRLTERNRVTRGLIDWIGYQQDHIAFHANPRLAGKATYSFKKLVRLAFDSVISMSTSPLYFVAYIGAIILPLSVLLALVMVVNALLGDPFNWHATGGAYMMVLILFLIGVLLVSQGIIGLYLSHIHTETQNRPLYIIDEEKSVKA